MQGKKGNSVTFVREILFCFAFVCVMLFPALGHAAFNGGNAMCVPVKEVCGCGTVPCKSGCCGGLNKFMCDCWDEANKAATFGKCTHNFHCEGKTTEGIDGKQGAVDAGLAKMMEGVLGKLMEALKGGGGGGGGGQQPGGQQGPLYPPCVRNAATNTVSPIPCTEANGQVNYGGSEGAGGTTDSGTLGSGTANTLLDALKGDTDTDDTGTGSTNSNTNTTTNTTDTSNTTTSNSENSNNATNASNTATIVQTSALTQQKTLAPQVQGVLQSDIIVSGSDGTIFARSRDPQSNTEVAGFYGGSTFGGQATSVIGRLCATRPWAQGFLGGFLTPGIFDSLCQRFGYQVGEASPQIQNTGVTTPTRRPTITITQPRVAQPATTTAPRVEPKVDIWANPPSVRLGSRTYIFWTSEGVESCTESGPNFSHNTLSGGASTVPLSDASTFTIECRTSDGRSVTDTVRVPLSL